MPRGVWSAKRERQYEHVLESCLTRRGRGKQKLCKRIAAATVNKTRSAHGETKAARRRRSRRRPLGCGCGS